MSSTTTTATTSSTSTATMSKRSSPLSYFSLDLPSRLMPFGGSSSSGGGGGGASGGGGSTSSSVASSATSPSMLTHQSFSLPPFVSRFVRAGNVSSSTSGETTATASVSTSISSVAPVSSSNRPPSVTSDHSQSLHPVQHHHSATASSPLLSRSPSPCRPQHHHHHHHHGPPPTSPVPSAVFAFVNTSGATVTAATSASASSSPPVPIPTSTASGSPNCTNSPPTSMQFRRVRSPMLCSLAKMNSVQSSTSNSTQGSQGSTSSLFGNNTSAAAAANVGGGFCSIQPPPLPLQPPTTPTPLGALQPELYKREKTIHVGLPSNVTADDQQQDNDFMYPDPPSTSSLSSTSSLGGQQQTRGIGGANSVDGGGASDCRASWGSRSNSQQQRSSISSNQGRNSSSSLSFGRLHFRLAYDFDKSDLLVHLVEVCDVQPTTEGGTASATGAAAGSTSSSSGGSCSSSNGASGTSGRATIAFREAHVRLALHPEVDQRRRQTKNTIRIDLTGAGGGTQTVTNRHSIDEHFKFPVSHDHLDHKTLRFQICDYDRFSRPRVMGDLQFSLAERDVSTSAVDIWAEMMRNTLPDESRPQLLISLSYLPSAERLTVVVLKAKNLVIPPNKTNIDPMVKLYLMVNGKRHKKKKSECRKGTNDPVWNQALTFTIPSPKLNSCSLQISVVDHGTDRGKNVLLGCITLGPEEDPSTPQRQHWQDMAHNVRKSVAMWHFLQ